MGGSGRKELNRWPSSFPAVLWIANVRGKKPDRKNKSWNLCLNLCSARWINPSLILVRNFNLLLLSILGSWLGSGLMNFSITLLKTLQDVKLQILTSILFHSMTAGKKKFLKKFVFVLKKTTGVFWTLLAL